MLHLKDNSSTWFTNDWFDRTRKTGESLTGWKIIPTMLYLGYGKYFIEIGLGLFSICIEINHYSYDLRHKINRFSLKLWPNFKRKKAESCFKYILEIRLEPLSWRNNYTN